MLKKIIHACPGKRQLIFVSATEQPESLALMMDISPNLIKTNFEEVPVNRQLEHFYLIVEERDKPEFIRKLIHASKTSKAIVFVHRTETAEILAARLTHHNIAVADLHGAYEKEDRKQAMQRFRNGTARILIASDLAARGLDIPGITHVLNLDMPSNPKDYLHRVGRCGRAGAKGTAISLVTEAELRLIKRLIKELNIEVKEITLREGVIQITNG